MFESAFGGGGGALVVPLRSNVLPLDLPLSVGLEGFSIEANEAFVGVEGCGILNDVLDDDEDDSKVWLPVGMIELLDKLIEAAGVGGVEPRLYCVPFLILSLRGIAV